MQRRHVLLGFATVAVIALVGTAIAGPDLGGGSGAKMAANGGDAKKAANGGDAKAAKKGRRGPPGPRGPAGPAGAAGAPGATGAPGADQAPRAFASIYYSGTPTNVVREAGASGITDANVVRQGAGLYCIYGLPFTPRHAQATLELVNSGAADEIYVSVTAVSGDSGDCPNTPSMEQAEVFVDDNGDPLGTFAGVDVPFMLTLD